MCLHLCTASPLTAGWFSETFWLSDHHIRQTSDSESGMFPCICSIHTEVSLPGWKYLIKICFYSPGQSERLRKATGTGLWKDGGQFGQWHDQVSELMGKFHKVLMILIRKWWTHRLCSSAGTSRLTFTRSAAVWGGIACRSWWTWWQKCRMSSGMWCLHAKSDCYLLVLGVIWMLLFIFSIATSWWIQMGRSKCSRTGRSEAIAWTVWTEPTSSRVCWPVAHCSHS